jgi:serine/threonine-protein kinase
VSESTGVTSDSNEPTVIERLERICDRFESEWRAGRRARIEDYLADLSPAARPAVLRELLLLELAYRRLAGETPIADEYEPRFPEHKGLVRATLAHLPDHTVSPGAAGAARWRGGAPDASRFHILRHHATGGLGEVYVARDHELSREVALKAIRDECADDPQSRARFLLEAEITGSLEHPGVVPVYALGQYEDGRPYYAMRFIRGESLKEAIERFYHSGTGGRETSERALEFRKLLGRFVDACEAIAYAHSRGVLHRDLKPANIMLGPYGETLVVDWGLARQDAELVNARENETSVSWPAQGQAGRHTLPGSPIGTPQYMSPEQATGRLDLLGPHTDVYGLGATLYSLLTGRPPFQERDLATMLSNVARGNFPRPRAVNRPIEPPLEAICLKAMGVELKARYASPGDLADDLEHWLADEPVTAYRDPLLTRLTRWGRRHRHWVTGAAATLVVAVAALSVGTALIGRERSEALHERDRAEINLGVARQVVDEMYTRVAGLMTDRGHMDTFERELLERAQRFYEQFALAQSQKAEIRYEASRAGLRVADIRARLGRNSEAESSYERAISGLARLTADYPAETSFQRTLATGHHDLGVLLRTLGRTEEADGQFQRAHAILDALSRRDSTTLDVQADLARLHNDRGVLLSSTGKPAEARAAFQQALAMRTTLANDHPESPRYQDELAETHHNLGMLARSNGTSEEVETQFQKALAIRRKLAVDRPRVAGYQYGLALDLNSLGNAYRVTGQFAKAEESYRDAVAIREKLAADHPHVPEYLNDLALSLANLGLFYRTIGQMREAESAYLRARELQTSLAADYPEVAAYQSDLGLTLNNLGVLYHYYSRGRADEASEAYQRALATRQKLAAEHPEVVAYREVLAQSWSNLGVFFYDTHAWADAESAYGHSIAITETLVQKYPENPDYQNELAKTKVNLGGLLGETQQWVDGEQLFQVALASQKELAERLPERIEITADLGGSEVDRGNFAKHKGEPSEAIGWFTSAVKTLESVLGREPRHGKTRHFLELAYEGRAECLTALGRDEEALNDWDRALQFGRDPPPQARRLARAATLARLGDHVPAVAEAATVSGLDEGENAFLAARVYAISSSAARADRALSSAERERLAQVYVERALELLLTAQRGGAFHTADRYNDLKNSRDFEAVRACEGFRTLMSDVGFPASPFAR